MTNGHDDGLPIADPSDLGIDVIGSFYDELHDAKPPQSTTRRLVT